MHDAFKVYTVIEKLPHKIESIFAQGTLREEPAHENVISLFFYFGQEW
jgi:hypothetical protein